ncbi:MAG TPA: hypothetical protein VGK48_10260 [Terriglobia bacterium]|jgi:hypothetical protein
MPVQMLVGGVEIQIRLLGSAAVADEPYSFSSALASSAPGRLTLDPMARRVRRQSSMRLFKDLTYFALT